MIYRLSCRCGAVFEVDERAVGRFFTCVGCHRRIYVDRVHLREIHVYRFTCACGTAFRVEEKAIGGTFRCPSCETAVRLDREHLTAVDDGCVSKLSRASLPVEFADEASGAPRKGA
jgi:hypothetical protein